MHSTLLFDSIVALRQFCFLNLACYTDDISQNFCKWSVYVSIIICISSLPPAETHSLCSSLKSFFVKINVTINPNTQHRISQNLFFPAAKIHGDPPPPGFEPFFPRKTFTPGGTRIILWGMPWYLEVLVLIFIIIMIL